MLKRSDDEIVAAVLSSMTYKEAAASLGISERTLYARVREDSIHEKLSAARARMADDATRLLRKGSATAVKVLWSIMVDTNASRQTRVNAANAFLYHQRKMTEKEDILDRLDRLEGLI